MSSFEVFHADKNYTQSRVKNINANKIQQYLWSILSQEIRYVVIKKNFGIRMWGDSRTPSFDENVDLKYKVILLTSWNSIFEEKQFDDKLITIEYVLKKIYDNNVKKAIILKKSF